MTAVPMTCAICGKSLAENAFRDSPLYPFCSKRCRQIDLLRWCKGQYAVVDRLTPEALDDLEGFSTEADDRNQAPDA